MSKESTFAPSEYGYSADIKIDPYGTTVYCDGRVMNGVMGIKIEQEAGEFPIMEIRVLASRVQIAGLGGKNVTFLKDCSPAGAIHATD
jgi:hypothetical protein